jgi:hypothetical protein
VVEGAAIDDSQGFPTYLAGARAALEGAMGTARGKENRNKNFRGRLVALADLIAERVPGRLRDDEISASSGVKVGGEDSVKGLQFVTVSSLIYDRAREAALGKEIPSEWFLQTIRD